MSFGAPRHHDKPEPYTLCHCRHEAQRMMQPFFSTGTVFRVLEGATVNAYGRSDMVLMTDDYVVRFEDEKDAENLAFAVLVQQGIDRDELNRLIHQRDLQQKADAGARRTP